MSTPLVDPALLTTAPRRLSLGGKRWELLVEPIPLDLDPEAEADGITDYRTLRIFIDPAQALAEFLDTVMHELQHAIAHAYGPLDGDDVDEQAAIAAGRGWSDLLVSNPKLGPWLSRLARAARKNPL